MQKFKKNRLLISSCVSLVLVIGICFSLNIKPETKPKEISREQLAMYVQSDDGNYIVSDAKAFPKEGYVLNLEKSTCKNSGILSQDSETKKISLKIQKNDQCALYFDKEMPTLKEYYDTVPKKTNVPSFGSSATTVETADGLFSMEDDYGTSYYFRGNVSNNYIKFGQDASDQDMWWRIIRFNGDGTVRMQYDGAGPTGYNTYTRGFALENQAWNETYVDAKYAGWMFGGNQGESSTSKEQAQRNETNSTIKIKVDEWYKKNIVDTGYGDYVADRIFCNDRSIPGKSITKWTRDTELGYGDNMTGYGALGRFLSGYNGAAVKAKSPIPQLTCPQENDKFTVEKENGGNGALTYPVGLITADEPVYI